MHPYKQNIKYQICIKIEELSNQCATTKKASSYGGLKIQDCGHFVESRVALKSHLSSITLMVSTNYIIAINGSCWNEFIKYIHT